MRAATFILVFACSVLTSCDSEEDIETSRCDFLDGKLDRLICAEDEWDEAIDELNSRHRRFVDVYDQALDGWDSGRSQSPTPAEFLADWSQERDQCVTDEFILACVFRVYDKGIAALETRYGLTEPAASAVYRCDDGTGIVASFYPGDASTVRLERAGATEVGWQVAAASGARYETSGGIVFWDSGREAMAEWPAGTRLRCELIESR